MAQALAVQDSCRCKPRRAPERCPQGQRYITWRCFRAAGASEAAGLQNLWSKKEQAVTPHQKQRPNPTRGCSLPSTEAPTPPRFLCPPHRKPRDSTASQITRFKYENPVVVTVSKELLGHRATQTKTGRTDLPSGASCHLKQLIPCLF